MKLIQLMCGDQMIDIKNAPRLSHQIEYNAQSDIETMSMLFDYLSESLEDIHSTRAAYAVKSAKSLMIKDFLKHNKFQDQLP